MLLGSTPDKAGGLAGFMGQRAAATAAAAAGHGSSSSNGSSSGLMKQQQQQQAGEEAAAGLMGPGLGQQPPQPLPPLQQQQQQQDMADLREQYGLQAVQDAYMQAARAAAAAIDAPQQQQQCCHAAGQLVKRYEGVIDMSLTCAEGLLAALAATEGAVAALESQLARSMARLAEQVRLGVLLPATNCIAFSVVKFLPQSLLLHCAEPQCHW
jgi:hypothetical protein